MIKKLMSLIFEEEVVDEVEEEPVPVRRSNPAKPAVKPEAKPAVPLPQEVKAVYLDTRKEKEKEKEPAVKKEPSSKLGKMTIAEDKPVKKKPVRVEPKEDYEFTPVISPIFGVLGEKSQPAKTPAAKKVSPVKSSLGTVISPIYGMDKPQEDKVEEIAERLDKPAAAVKEEPLINVSLDELLQKPQEAEADRKNEEEGSDKTVVSQNLSLFDDNLNS